MPKDNRVFIGSVSVRVDDTRTKLELSPAEEHGGEPGLFRVRIGRRWVDTPEGDKLFFDRVRLADFIAGHVFGDAVVTMPEKAPNIPRGSRVSARFWYKDNPHSEAVYTSSPVYRGFDGRFYVWVMTYEAGFIAVPVEDVTLIQAKRRPVGRA